MTTQSLTWPSARRAAAAASAAVAIAAAAFVLRGALSPHPAELASASEGRARAGPDGVQEIALVSERGAYAPNVLHARANAPLRLRVAVRDPHSCSTRILVPDLKLDLDLPARGEATAIIPPAPPGAYVFTCEMRMVKGVIYFE